ncbi:magnesium transporter [Flavobacteriaceae bacterium]|nr:magnesium transporter [Flavobacteriaceae bacterium]
MNQELTKDLFRQIKDLIDQKNATELKAILHELHPADIAEVLDDLDFKQAIYVIKLLDSEVTSDILTELDEDTRDQVLQNLSSKEIAEEIDELDTDDAVDILYELPDIKKAEVIAHIEDVEHAKDIVELMRFDPDTAGGLMGKELVKVNENWTNMTCVREMRKQAAEFDRVHTIYVVDDHDVLKGRLSLKSLLTTSTKTPVKEVYNPKIHSVHINDSDEEIAQIMQKYDLFVVPVVDEIGRLVGQITIDDVVDIIKDEAEKDYQMAAGLTDDVEADDNIWELTRARLPWLVLGLIGGMGAASIMGGFEDAFETHPELFLFTPMIAAMGGNVGVQSSAIIVQSLANGNLKGNVWTRLFKEISMALISSIVVSGLIYGFTHFIQGQPNQVSFVVAFSLTVVIIVAALIGTFVPLILDKRGIDPALATGPFITTSNDIFGIFIYFYIAKIILGF